MNFSVYWKQFQGNACMKVSSLWDGTLTKFACKQASTLLTTGSQRLLKSLKQFHTDRHYHWVKGQKVWKKEYTTNTDMFNLFIYWWLTNNFSQSVTEWDFCAGFLRKISEILGTGVERDTLMTSSETNWDRCFVLWSSSRKTLPHTEKYFEIV